jgi:GxxExxY protein
LLRNISFERQVERPISYKSVSVGHDFPGLLVGKELVVEIKAVSSLIDCHITKALNYLAASGPRLAVAVDFGAQSLQTKRVIR